MHIFQRIIIWCSVLMLISACGRSDQPSSASNPTQDIAQLVQHAPSSETLTFTAYTWFVQIPSQGPPMTRPSKGSCPLFTINNPVLTDVAVPSSLRFLGGEMTNFDANYVNTSAPWLLPVSTFALPYHARYTGHRNDPDLATCPHADRIIVVDSLVTTFEANAPIDASFAPVHVSDTIATWPRYTDSTYGLSFAYPPEWQVAIQAPRGGAPLVNDAPPLTEITIPAPQDANTNVTFHVYQGETHRDDYGVGQLPLLQGGVMSLFQLDAVRTDHGMTRQPLPGYFVIPDMSANPLTTRIVLNGQGRTYVAEVRYPIGIDARQDALDTLSSIILSIVIEGGPGPTPTSAVKQTIGSDIKVTKEQAFTIAQHAKEMILALPLTALDGDLVSEAKARDLSSSCKNFGSHPEGVWFLHMSGFDPDSKQPLMFNVIIDATTGAYLCAEVPSTEKIHPTLPPGQFESTVVPPPTPTIRASPTPVVVTPTPGVASATAVAYPQP